jgi:hypothetical protein
VLVHESTFHHKVHVTPYHLGVLPGLVPGVRAQQITLWIRDGPKFGTAQHIGGGSRPPRDFFEVLGGGLRPPRDFFEVLGGGLDPQDPPSRTPPRPFEVLAGGSGPPGDYFEMLWWGSRPPRTVLRYYLGGAIWV